ncbi:hypothetical protein XENOCAPTIV_006262, partial [Xenoophorus captivus]
LVTWSRDQTLRIWRVDPQLQKLCVSDMVEELLEGMTLTLESEKSLTSQEPEGQQGVGPAADILQGSFFRNECQNSLCFPFLCSGDQDSGSGLAQTLQQEFSLVNLQIRNVNVEYPNNAAPSFQFVSPTTIPSAMKIKIQKVREGTAAPDRLGLTNSSRCGSLGSVSYNPDRHISAEGEEEPELSGALCPAACVLFRVGYGENIRTWAFRLSFEVASLPLAPPTGLTHVCCTEHGSLQRVPTSAVCLRSFHQTQEDSPASGPFVLSNPVTPSLQAFPRVTSTYGSYQDANIPFPRTSGARFCGTGCLVYFTRPITMHRSVPPTEPTPRSLSALSAYHSGVLTPMKMRSESQSTLRLYSGSPTRSDKETVSISSFYYKER